MMKKYFFDFACNVTWYGLTIQRKDKIKEKKK